METSNNVVVRAGVESDCDVILQLIKDLAVYEGMLDQVKITAEDLKRDAFHTSPRLVQTVVAEADESSGSEKSKIIVGYALLYETYSTWNGKAIHMEDLFVRPEYRQKGVGHKILKHLANVVLEGNYARLSWECIDWNEPAIKFYTKLGAVDVTIKDGWDSYRFGLDAIKKLASE